MKHTFLLILLFNSNLILSQDISVELSIEWKKEQTQNPFFSKKDNTSIIPYLKITYRNLSNRNLYFFKFNIADSMGNPKLLSLCPIEKIRDRIFLDTINKKKKIERYILLDHLYMSAYVPYLSNPKTKKYDNCDKEMDLIHKYYFTDWLYRKYGKSYKKHFYSNPEEVYNSYLQEPIDNIHLINKELIVTTLKDYFVFLKKGEYHTEFINLAGFKKIGGKYTFKLSSDRVFKEIYIKRSNQEMLKEEQNQKKQDSIKNKNNNEEIEVTLTNPIKREKFPLKINRYDLYYGPILSNKVIIEF